jgi:hypothetical protein
MFLNGAGFSRAVLFCAAVAHLKGEFWFWGAATTIG